jgi:DNA-binding LacI/PurR family transcriptional regulator
MTELPSRRKPPTIREVARAAGVSPALVSIVLRGAPGASERTRARVLAAAEQVGYRANRTASLMKLRRTKHLGITVNVRNTFQAELAENIQAAAAQSGYEIVPSLVTATHDEDRAIETLLGFRCESVILLGSQLPAARLADLARELPLVLVGRRVNLGNVDVVRSADHRGQALVVDHLAGLGHRDIAHVDGGRQPISAQRRQGYRAAMRRNGLGEYVRVVTGGDSERDGHRAAADLLRRERLPTAVCAYNDHCALGVIDALGQAGVRVPGDCSVTGYDNSPVAQLTAIDLTSVSQEAAVLAQSAVRAAVERLEGHVAGATDTVLEPRLVVRGSSSPSPPGSLPGWSALVFQHGAQRAAADFPQYRIVF